MSNVKANAEMTQPPQDQPSLRDLDKAFANWVAKNFCLESNDADKERTECVAKAVSYALDLKHTCLDLSAYKDLGDPVLDRLLQKVDAGDVLSVNNKAIETVGSVNGTTPLIRSGNGQQIWLQKYYVFERNVARKIEKMVTDVKADLTPGQKSDLDKLYLDDEYKEQREAVEKALTHRFSVITGGPGTGKTYTAARIIALMTRHGIDGKLAPRIALAAPTGKAANRVHQSLALALDTTEVKEIIGERSVPEEATTLHSLLKIYRGSPRARQNATNPLPVEVLIIDEASMIDLPMMHRVLEAMPEDAHLILLGDKDQLSSVEAGSVLAELCAENKPYIATINKSRRYEKSPEIGALAEAINVSDPNITPSLPDLSKNKHVTMHRLVEGENTWNPEWLNEVKVRLKDLTDLIVQGKKVTDILKRQTDFQILCALRKGPSGVMGINSMVERMLKKKKDGWYKGRPVMILSNDHQRKLYNGDVGLVLPVREHDGEWVIDIDRKTENLRACFPMGGEKVKTISFAQMPSFETCYAMTVHKSQGSEYKKVLFVLPADKRAVENNPVITKELIYTGVTRAKEAVEIWCGEGVLEAAVQKQTVRMSGLRLHANNQGVGEQ